MPRRSLPQRWPEIRDAATPETPESGQAGRGSASISCPSAWSLSGSSIHLPVTTGTVRRRIDMLGGNNLTPHLFGIAIGLPAQFGHEFHRTKVRRGIAVAIQAK